MVMMNLRSLIFLVLLGGCATFSPEVVKLKEDPPVRDKERVQINKQQRKIYQTLIEKSKEMKKDLEGLTFVKSAEVSLWPDKAILDLTLQKEKTRLTVPDKREILMIVVKYKYSAENTKLIWRPGH